MNTLLKVIIMVTAVSVVLLLTVGCSFDFGLNWSEDHPLIDVHIEEPLTPLLEDLIIGGEEFEEEVEVVKENE